MQTAVAVTGASGHIGNVVCRLLIEKGYQVKALCRSDTRALAGLPLTLVQGDVLNQADLLRLTEGCRAVINCAAVISLDGDQGGKVSKTNMECPRLVLDAARQNGVACMVHLSSTHAVMELPLSGVYDETRPYKGPESFAYDYSKSMGEQGLLLEAKGSGVKVVVLRPSSVVGPFDFKPSELGNALLRFYRGKVPVLPPGGYNFVDVRDVAESVIAAIDKGKDGEVYLISGKYYGMKAFARLVGQLTGKKVPQSEMPYGLLKLLLPFVRLQGWLTGTAPLFTIESLDALRHGHPNMDNSKAAAQLGHRCRPLEATLEDFYNWQKSRKVIV